MTLTATTPADSATVTPIRRAAPAKVRILETALRRFYDDGIRAVGVDLLIAESSVTKATFYKHFGSKDRLVMDYMEAQRDRAVTALDDVIGSPEQAHDALARIGAHILETIEQSGYRGSPFINAAAEYPDPDHPVRVLTTQHQEYLAARFTTVFDAAGHPMPGEAADDLLIAMNGAMTWVYVGDPIAARAAFRRTLDRLQAECGTGR